MGWSTLEDRVKWALIVIAIIIAIIVVSAIPSWAKKENVDFGLPTERITISEKNVTHVVNAARKEYEAALHSTKAQIKYGNATAALSKLEGVQQFVHPDMISKHLGYDLDDFKLELVRLQNEGKYEMEFEKNASSHSHPPHHHHNPKTSPIPNQEEEDRGEGDGSEYV